MPACPEREGVLHLRSYECTILVLILMQKAFYME